MFDVTVKAVLPAGAVTFWVEGATDSTGVAPACETVTTMGVSPFTVTVTLAVLADTEVFSLKVAVMVPFPVPEVVTVHQPWLLEAVHAAFEVTLKGVVPAAAATFWFEGVTDRVGAAWVTVTTTAVRPGVVTVTFAMRCEAVLFSVKVAVILPSPVPEGVTVHQVWLLEAVHVELEVTAKEVEPATGLTF